MKYLRVSLNSKISGLLRKYHSMSLVARAGVYLIVLALALWLIWNLPLTAHITSFGYLNKELSNSMFLGFLNDVASDSPGAFFSYTLI